MRTDLEHLRMVSASAISPVLAYYTPTKGFLLALVLAFAFNIYAGMKADGVSFTCCENFSFGKFKNALAELVLYVVIICFLFTSYWKPIVERVEQERREAEAKLNKKVDI